MADSPQEIARRYAATASRRRPARVTPRELRDALGRRTLGAATRIELADALRDAGLEARPPLADLELDDVVELRPLRWRRARAIGTRSYTVAERVGLLLGLVLGIAAVVAFVSGWFDSPPAPRPMSGDFNVLVAPFEARGAAGARDGVALAETTARALGDGLRRSQPTAASGAQLDVQVRGPAGVGVVGGSTQAERAAAAARLADAHDADVVVFGTVIAGTHASRVIPGVYIGTAKLPDADELAGAYRLAAIVDPAGSINDGIAWRQQLRVVFLRRVDSLGALVAGLGDFQARDWVAARRRFARAATAELPGPTTAFARLFEGNAASKLRDFAGASRAYRSALAAQPTLLRAAVGLAEVDFQRAHGACTARTADAAGLRHAAAAFRAVLAQVAADAPLVVALRAHFGLGRVLMCASQAEVVAGWATAAHELRLTLALADRADPARFRDERAEAHAGLGLIALPPPGGGAQARAAYEHALVEYRRALAISDDPARRAVYLEMIAFTDRRLGRAAAAALAAARAHRLDASAEPSPFLKGVPVNPAFARKRRALWIVR